MSLAYEAVAAQERIDGWKREFESWKREFEKVQAKRDAYRERAEQADARVAELEAAGKLLATQGREMATGLCSDTREVGATGVCVACQVRMVRYLEVWRAALEGKR